MDNIEIRTYHKKEFNGTQEKAAHFLLNLDEERKTFWGADIPNQNYKELVDDLIDTTFVFIVAYENDELVGLVGMFRPRGLFYRILPLFRGYIVVKKSHQGRGIGTKLTHVQAEIMTELFAYNFSIIDKDNAPIRRINKKHGFITVHIDSRYHYSIKTYNKLLSFLDPLFIPLSKAIIRFRFNE